ncbi:MAG: hypothetical protein M9894_09690 [Planctomycetes bacterium]|nr:hypothetical protein [Planctomycetota bacterium]
MVKLIAPLLRDALGWPSSAMHTEVAVAFQAGRQSWTKKADLVGAPKRPESTGQDESWLVVEAKKPGQLSDEALEQARSYADRLKVSMYAVIDGGRLLLYRRQRFGTDAKELDIEITADTLSKNRQDIEASLDFVKLRTRHDLLNQEDKKRFDDTLKAIGDLKSERMPNTVWVEVDANKEVRWLGPVPSVEIETFWGSPAATALKPVDLTIDADFGDISEDLRAVIVRLAFHGGLSVLSVREPDKWKKFSLDMVYQCLGVPGRNWHPVDAPQQARWAVRGITGPRPDTSKVPALPQRLLAERCRDAMDGWATEALNEAVDEALRSNEPASRHGVEIAADLRRALAAEWTTLRAELGPVNVPFLTAALSTCKGHDRWAALLRVGPRTVRAEGCLLLGLLLLLLWRDFLREKGHPDLVPHVLPPGFPINLKTEAIPGHLLSVQWVNARDLQLALLDVLDEEPLLLLVPWSTRDPIELSRMNARARSISRGAGITSSLLSRANSTVLSLGLPLELREALARGRTETHACLAVFGQRAANELYGELVTT